MNNIHLLNLSVNGHAAERLKLCHQVRPPLAKDHSLCTLDQRDTLIENINHYWYSQTAWEYDRNIEIGLTSIANLSLSLIFSTSLVITDDHHFESPTCTSSSASSASSSSSAPIYPENLIHNKHIITNKAQIILQSLNYPPMAAYVRLDNGKILCDPLKLAPSSKYQIVLILQTITNDPMILQNINCIPSNLDCQSMFERNKHFKSLYIYYLPIATTSILLKELSRFIVYDEVIKCDHNNFPISLKYIFDSLIIPQNVKTSPLFLQYNYTKYLSLLHGLAFPSTIIHNNQNNNNCIKLQPYQKDLFSVLVSFIFYKQWFFNKPILEQSNENHQQLLQLISQGSELFAPLHTFGFQSLLKMCAFVTSPHTDGIDWSLIPDQKQANKWSRIWTNQQAANNVHTQLTTLKSIILQLSNQKNPIKFKTSQYSTHQICQEVLLLVNTISEDSLKQCTSGCIDTTNSLPCIIRNIKGCRMLELFINLANVCNWVDLSWLLLGDVTPEAKCHKYPENHKQDAVLFIPNVIHQQISCWSQSYKQILSYACTVDNRTLTLPFTSSIIIDPITYQAIFHPKSHITNFLTPTIHVNSMEIDHESIGNVYTALIGPLWLLHMYNIMGALDHIAYQIRTTKRNDKYFGQQINKNLIYQICQLIEELSIIYTNECTESHKFPLRPLVIFIWFLCRCRNDNLFLFNNLKAFVLYAVTILDNACSDGDNCSLIYLKSLYNLIFGIPNSIALHGYFTDLQRNQQNPQDRQNKIKNIISDWQNEKPTRTAKRMECGGILDDFYTRLSLVERVTIPAINLHNMVFFVDDPEQQLFPSIDTNHISPDAFPCNNRWTPHQQIKHFFHFELTDKNKRMCGYHDHINPHKSDLYILNSYASIPTLSKLILNYVNPIQLNIKSELTTPFTPLVSPWNKEYEEHEQKLHDEEKFNDWQKQSSPKDTIMANSPATTMTVPKDTTIANPKATTIANPQTSTMADPKATNIVNPQTTIVQTEPQSCHGDYPDAVWEDFEETKVNPKEYTDDKEAEVHPPECENDIEEDQPMECEDDNNKKVHPLNAIFSLEGI